jgi:4-amino-4-deoxy-L-arabinose transferase-like glycosyltransferase
MSSPDPSTARWPAHWAWLGIALATALGYLFELGGDHIPRNGDELVYAHIARLTAESGHWLPLVSSYDFMRNTKPPLLFWQAMVAGGWGEHWTLLDLRLPSVIYLWATALMVGLLAWKVSRNAGPGAEPARPRDRARLNHHAVSMGAIAATLFLSFFSTYRYGRPYLTSAPETFWLFGVFFALAWSPSRWLASRWKFPLIAGLAIGIGCLYKSFAMVVPVGFGLALCYQTLHARRAPWQLLRPGFFTDGLKVVAICAIAVAVFSLWFALDPQPGEVWREFVVGENAGKFKSSPGYLKVAFSGSGGILVILTGYFVNAGLLFPLTVGCAWAAWRSYRTGRRASPGVSDTEKVMWLWLLALALVFTLPDQRSARYLIPAMPAVAVLTALYWSRIPRIWFSLTLLFCALGALALGQIAYGAIRATQDKAVYPPLFWILLGVIEILCVIGMFKKDVTRAITVPAGFVVLFALAWVTAPFNGPLGHFSPETVDRLQGQQLMVPNNFNGQFERYQFFLKGAKIIPYAAPQPVDFEDVDALLKSSRYALVLRRIGQAPCQHCRVLDVRWDLRSRQDASEGRWAAITTPDTFWYAKEYLVERIDR